MTLTALVIRSIRDGTRERKLMFEIVLNDRLPSQQPDPVLEDDFEIRDGMVFISEHDGLIQRLLQAIPIHRISEINRVS